MKYYEIQEGDWRTNITEIEVERETDESIWIAGSRSAKRTQSKCYFPTFESGKQWLISRAKEQIDQDEIRLSKSKKLLEKYESQELQSKPK